MSLQTYLARLEDTIRSRQDIAINDLLSAAIASRAVFEAHLQFFDNSTILIRETLIATDVRDFTRLRYVYHYQDADNALIFRYDNSPTTPTSPPFHPINTSAMKSSLPPPPISPMYCARLMH